MNNCLKNKQKHDFGLFGLIFGRKPKSKVSLKVSLKVSQAIWAKGNFPLGNTKFPFEIIWLNF